MTQLSDKQKFCSLESPTGLRSYRLKYLLQAPATSQNGQSEDRFNVDEPQPVQPQPIHQPKPDVVRPNQQVNQFQDDNSVCGIPVAGFTQSLVIGGQAAGRGEWY